MTMQNQDEQALASASQRVTLPLLPGNVTSNILDFLPKGEIANALVVNKGLFAELNGSGALDYLKTGRIVKHILPPLIELVAREGEDNQNKAKTLLDEYGSVPKAVSNAIVERTLILDAAGRAFNHMSAFGYAFWAGDTRMRKMLSTYMDGKAKAKAYQECKHIYEVGVSYTFRGETIEASKHFDFQPLQNTYQDYIRLRPMDNAIDALQWEEADAVWRTIGYEQAKLPTHTVQECYCSKRVVNSDTLNEPDLERTIKCYNAATGQVESWWSSPGISNLGAVYSVYKGGFINGTHGRGPTPGMWRCSQRWRSRVDAEAIALFCQQRTVDDRLQTLDELNVLEHIAYMSPQA